MPLPAFATVDDLGLRLPAGVSVDEDRAEAALTDASALIHAESNEVWVEGDALVDDVPPVALTVCCKAAVRALVNPAGAAQESVGPFSHTYGDVYLTQRERDMIRQAAGGTSGLWTLSTTRLDSQGVDDFAEHEGTVYLDVAGTDEPIPFHPSPWPTPT